MVPRACANCRAPLASSAVSCAHCALTVGDEWSRWRGHRSESANTAESDEVMGELKQVLAPSIEIMSPLGAGGMGLVYLAHDMVLKRLVAVKVLSPSFATEDTARERFRREVEAIAAITHPHVVSIYQVGELPRLGAPYFLMQYVEGTTLRAEVRPGEIVPEAKVRRIIGEVAMALSAAHARGLVHRDIKPANIMLERESGRALVVDFGISATVATSRRSTEPRLSTQGMFVGTAAYMSPEQASGVEITQASDIYSLGIVAFELLTGRLPFTGHSTAEIMAGHGSDDPAPLIRSLRPDLHPQLAELIDRSLRKNPAERPSADEIARLLFASARSYIEWPPPGLGQLRALGARLSETLGIAEGIGLMFFLLLMLQPAIASLRWHERETSAFWNLVLLPNAVLRGLFEGSSATAEQLSVDAAPIWGFLLTLCLAVMLVCFPFIIGRALHLAYRVRWARRSGYPWKVIFAVAWDYRRDTGALLNGTGIYALLSRRERRRLIRLRWMEQSAGAIGVLLGALTPLIWFISASGRASPADGRLLSPNEALFIIAPPLLALLVLMICKRPEARHRTRMQRQRVFMTRKVTPLVRPELVSTWLRSVRLPATPRARMPGVATGALPIAMIVIATGVVTALFLSALPSIVATTASRRPAVEWVQSFQTDSLRPIPWQDVRAALPDIRGAHAGPADSVLANLLHLNLRAGGSDDSTRTSPATVRLARILSRPRLLLSEAEVRWFSEETRGRDITAWRAIARSAPFMADPQVWSRSLPVQHPYELTRPSVLREVASVNAAAAILHWQNGDTAGARDRIDENLALGAELVRAPVPSWHTLGLEVVREAHAVEKTIGPATSGAGTVARDSSTRVLNLEAVLIAARTHRPFFDQGRHRLLMADPVAPPGLRFVGDTTLSPADRWALAGGATTGFCHNTREVLFGVDRRRPALMDASFSALRDIPGSDEWGRLHRKWLADGLPLPPDVSPSARRVRTHGVLGLPSRLRFCSVELPRLSREARPD